MHTYPHDPTAFTEGLFYLNGYLYESTGLERHSSIRKVRLETGEVVQKHDIPPQYFGEGIVNWKTPSRQPDLEIARRVRLRPRTFKLQRQFHYEGEGWALTQDGKQIMMSDGTSEIRWLNPRRCCKPGDFK